VALIQKLDELQPGPAVVQFPADALARVDRWAATTPQALALLHKQRGKWEGWRWRDVLLRLGQLRSGLLRAGIGPHSRLAVSGALEPDLILLSLAAHAAGAVVVEVDRYAHGVALRTLLQAAFPTHAFVQEKRNISAWLNSGHVPSRPVSLYSAQSISHESGVWRLEPLGALVEISGDHASDAIVINLRRALAHRQVLWVEQGTEWPDGLTTVLEGWLNTGGVLAAPEVKDSSARDRQEVQPSQILASSAHVNQLHSELQARLPITGSWQHLLTHRTNGAAAGPLLRWLQRHIATLHGLPLQRQNTTSPTLKPCGELT